MPNEPTYTTTEVDALIEETKTELIQFSGALMEQHRGVQHKPDEVLPMQPTVLVSPNGDRSEAHPLDGSVLESDKAYAIFAEPDDRKPIASVVFTSSTGTHVERLTPYDRFGTTQNGDAHMGLALGGDSGRDQLKVTVRYEDGEVISRTVEFEVAQVDDPVPDPVPDPSAVTVPAGEGWDWLVGAHNDHGFNTFLFEADAVGPFPVWDGTEYSANLIIDQGTLVATTPAGREIYQRIIGNPLGSGIHTLRSPSNGSIFRVGPGQQGRPVAPKFEHLEITEVATKNLQDGAIDLDLFQSAELRDCWIHENEGTAVRIGRDCVVSRNLIHENEHLGIGGVNRGGSILITENELHHNSQGHDSVLWEHGEIKVVLGGRLSGEPRGLIIGNYVHDGSIAIWTDIDASWDVKSNAVIDCWLMGIFGPELTTLVTRPIEIVDNHCVGNGFHGHRDVWSVMQAQIVTAASARVRIVANYCEATDLIAHGISVVQQQRDEPKGSHNWYYCDELVIAENTVKRPAESRRRRIGFYDDTGNKGTANGFIPNYLANRNNDEVPADRKATVTLGPNVLL